mmetsp:Transcript_120193/g.383744  ORF Transcript_120193/g.383744 Transcript_120193/m.383744 type:complete len:271 (-) Transcript_120193:473-1285(-)
MKIFACSRNLCRGGRPVSACQAADEGVQSNSDRFPLDILGHEVPRQGLPSPLRARDRGRRRQGLPPQDDAQIFVALLLDALCGLRLQGDIHDRHGGVLVVDREAQQGLFVAALFSGRRLQRLVKSRCRRRRRRHRLRCLVPVPAQPLVFSPQLRQLGLEAAVSLPDVLHGGSQLRLQFTAVAQLAQNTIRESLRRLDLLQGTHQVSPRRLKPLMLRTQGLALAQQGQQALQEGELLSLLLLLTQRSVEQTWFRGLEVLHFETGHTNRARA